MKIEFSLQIFEITRTSNFMKIGPVVAELFHADGQTDMTKLTVFFRNFVNSPNNKPKGNTHSHIRLSRFTLCSNILSTVPNIHTFPFIPNNITLHTFRMTLRYNDANYSVLFMIFWPCSTI